MDKLINFLLIALSLFISLFIVWQNLLIECVPHDEGLLGQSANRFMSGELPHRDFDDPYTGFLNVIHSFAFYVFGDHISSLRYFNFTVFSIVLVVFSMYLKTYLSAVPLSLSIISYALWSILVYPASMPTWYMIYLSFFAGLLLVNKEGRFYFLNIIAAGFLLGIVTLIKINGVFLLFSGIWALLLLFGDEKSKVHHRKLERFFLIIVKYIIIFFPLVIIISVLKNSLDFSHAIYFLLPVLLLGVVLSKNTILSTGCFKKILLLCISFGIVLFIYGFHYYLNNGLMELLNGVFITPKKRTLFVFFPPPHYLITICLSILLLIMSLSKDELFKKIFYLFSIILYCVYVYYPKSGANISLALVMSIPLSLSIYSLIEINRIDKQKYFWLSFCLFSLILHYPFCSQAYVAYTSIFVFLASFYIFLSGKNIRISFIKLNLSLCFIVISGLLYNSLDISFNKFLIKKLNYEVPVQENQKKPYCIKDDLISLINQNSAHDESILSFPDSPEVYYFTKRKNPTRYIYEVLSETSNDYDEYFRLISESNIPLVVINKSPCCSRNLSGKELDFIKEYYEREAGFSNYTIFYKRK